MLQIIKHSSTSTALGLDIRKRVMRFPVKSAKCNITASNATSFRSTTACTGSSGNHK